MRYVLLAAAGASVFIAAFGMQSQAKPQDESATPEFYTTKVQPILEAHCYRCHGEGNHRGGLNMGSRDGFLAGGHHGPALVPGDPSSSLLITLIRQDGTGDFAPPMPPPPHDKLSDDDIATITRWVKAGAVMPASTPAAAATPGSTTKP